MALSCRYFRHRRCLLSLPRYDSAEFSALQSVADQFGFEIVRHPLGGLDDIEGAVAASLQDDVAGLHAVLGRGAFRIDRGDHDALAAGAGDAAGRASDRPRWARRAVGEGVKSCPRAGCGKSACGEFRATPYTRKPALRPFTVPSNAAAACDSDPETPRGTGGRDVLPPANR